MIEKIITAKYFDELLVANTPWNKTSMGFTLLWLVNGTAEITVKSRHIKLNQSQLAVISPNTVFSVDFDIKSGVRFAFVEFAAKDNHRLDDIANRNITISGREKELLFDFFRTASTVCEEQHSALRKDYLHSLLKTLLLRLILNKKAPMCLLPERMKMQTHISDQRITSDIKRYLKEHLYCNVSLEDLSRNIGASTNTMNRIFKKDTGSSIIEYFLQIKTEEAIKLIIEGELSFRSISEKLCFGSPEYFSRIFKKKTGLTPTDFSKQHIKWQGCIDDFFITNPVL